MQWGKDGEKGHPWKPNIIDYATLGITRLPERLLLGAGVAAFVLFINANYHRYANLLRGLVVTLGVIVLLPLTALFVLTNYVVRPLVAACLTVAVLPIVVLSHVITKIIHAIESERAMRINVNVPGQDSTMAIRATLKMNKISSVNSPKTSAYVEPYEPRSPLREVLFTSNACAQFAHVTLNLNEERDVENAVAIARVNRQACQELVTAHALRKMG